MPTIHLVDLKKNVKKYLLKMQGEAKEKRGISVYSLQRTIEQIVIEHRDLKKENDELRKQLSELIAVVD